MGKCYLCKTKAGAEVIVWCGRKGCSVFWFIHIPPCFEGFPTFVLKVFLLLFLPSGAWVDGWMDA